MTGETIAATHPRPRYNLTGNTFRRDDNVAARLWNRGMSKIVISYRRADSAAISGRIFDRLASHYGDDAVFMDIDKIPFGTDFREHIRKVLLEGDILLAVIGPNWLGKGADGTSRIKDEADPVRVEVETALRQKTRMIPVLVDGASMPSTADLPDALRDLAYLNAAPLDVGRDFRAHMDRLIRSIDEVLGPERSRPAAARIGKRRSALRVALITVAAAVLIVLVAAASTLLMPGSSPERPAEPARQSAASAPAAPREVINPPALPRVEPDIRNSTGPSRFPSDIPPAAPPRAEPEPATYRVLANVSGGVQNLRSGPAVRYSLVVAIPAGATGITLGACRASEDGSRPWCAARWRSYSGFISSCCIVDEKTGAAPRVD
jgi:TIR domain